MFVTLRRLMYLEFRRKMLEATASLSPPGPGSGKTGVSKIVLW